MPCLYFLWGSFGQEAGQVLKVFKKLIQMQIKTYCDHTQVNEALCSKIDCELWAIMYSKITISQKLKYA